MPSINIDVSTEGTTTWGSDLPPLEILGVMSECIFDMYNQLFDAPDRPFFEGVQSRVCIEYDGENISIAYRPEADVVVAKGLTMAALAALCKRAAEPDFNPLEGVLGAIMTPIQERSKVTHG
jgi:hypothetical protein